MRNYKDYVNEVEKLTLSKYAQLSQNTKGRQHPISECMVRGEYQRDRDKIIHSKAFRRLKHKTQVFLSPEGDHYRTRLTHTLEVAQIGRTIARALRLNEDLVEAISLGHDLGHTPFGHAGERKLNELVQGGFKHYEQSLRVVDLLENDGKGLNLTYEVRRGIVVHSDPYTDSPETLESEIVKYADKFAYMNHDIEDAIRGGVLTEEDIPNDIRDVLGHSKAERINTLIIDMIEESFDKPYIHQSKEIEKYTLALHDFMYKNVYLSKKAKPEEGKAVQILEQLFKYYMDDPKRIPDEFFISLLDQYPKDRVIADYISSFTDHYCVKTFEDIFIPKFWNK